MEYGICCHPILPLRKSRSERSVIIYQLLLGELYSVVERAEEWILIRMEHDGSQGWLPVCRGQEISPEQGACAKNAPWTVTRRLFDRICRRGEWEEQLIVAGSLLPAFDSATGRFSLGDDDYLLKQPLPEPAAGRAEEVLQGAWMYYNAPYVAGGRTPYGIDNTGLIQMAFRMAGCNLPHALESLAEAGETLSFLEEAEPGDVVLLGDESKITHAGLIWAPGRVLHASGRVRIDRIDNHGIFNESLKRYTHSIKVLKRML